MIGPLTMTAIWLGLSTDIPIQATIYRTGDDEFAIRVQGTIATGVSREQLLAVFPNLPEIQIGWETTATWETE